MRDSRPDFLRALADDPGDATTPLVYADWLDEHGQPDAATFLRLQHQIGQLPRRDAAFRALCRKARALGDRLEEAWVGAVSRPLLAGTCWAGSPRSRRGLYVFRYLPGGVLNYTSPSGTFQNGTWRQVGPVVLMETNRHYADYAGTVHGDRILGSGHNIVGARWRWEVARTTAPELCDPGEPDETVYEHSPPPRPATATRARRRPRPAPGP